MLQAAAAAVLLLASKAWHSHGWSCWLLALGGATQPSSQASVLGPATRNIVKENCSRSQHFTRTISSAAEHGSWHTVVHQHQPLSKDNLYQCQCQIAHPPPGTNSSNLVSTLQLNCHFKTSAAYNEHHTSTQLIMLTLQWSW